MSEPLVACILLTRDRPEMAKRAVECFRAQRYENKLLCILDTSVEPEHTSGWFVENDSQLWTLASSARLRELTIGALRNHVARWIVSGPTPWPEILVHWDDDDYSHPERIAEQVTLLGSGYDAVGYNEMLFARECPTCDGGRANMLPCCPLCGLEYDPARETPVMQAWLYTKRNGLPGGALGTSLCYWTRVAQRKPFPDLPKGPQGTGEDWVWQQGLNVHCVSSLYPLGTPFKGNRALAEESPRMVARIHAGNTSKAYQIEDLISRGSTEWTRRPDWDTKIKGMMAL